MSKIHEEEEMKGEEEEEVKHIPLKLATEGPSDDEEEGTDGDGAVQSCE